MSLTVSPEVKTDDTLTASRVPQKTGRTAVKPGLLTILIMIAVET